MLIFVYYKMPTDKNANGVDWLVSVKKLITSGSRRLFRCVLCCESYLYVNTWSKNFVWRTMKFGTAKMQICLVEECRNPKRTKIYRELWSNIDHWETTCLNHYPVIQIYYLLYYRRHTHQIITSDERICDQWNCRTGTRVE